eukprot:GGOE01036240.1.p1 GENE.GGOE01036240.1~~GGOE01036240.1.p1  ORF type:complete len:521 (-),score=92.48 GGOE01036240.1:435-1997(-)
MATEGKKDPTPTGKKGKKQKQSLGEFLGVPKPVAKPKGSSWASDDEDGFMSAPTSTEAGAKEASDWRAGPSKAEGERRPFASGGGKGLPDRPPYTLYVGNLAFNTTEEELSQFFRTVESVRLVVDRATNASKGYGYVTFPSRDDLANALKLDGQSLGGRAVRLDVAQDRGGKGGGKGGGSGGGFGDGSGGFGSSGFGGGRDFMGTGQVERAEKQERGNKAMGGFGTPAWDKGRDAMGSGVADERRPPRDRTAPTFSRDTMGSEQGAAAPSPSAFGAKPERRGFGGDPDGWSVGREAMGTGVVEDRKPPPQREDRPPREAPAFSRDSMASEQAKESEQRPAPRAAPNRLMFGASDTAPSRDLFGAEEAPERPERPERPEKPERPPRSEPWRPGGGKGAAAADLSGGSNWRAGSSAAEVSPDSPPKQLGDDNKPRPYQPKNKQTSQELEVKKEKPAPKVPLTQEELFQQHVAKTQKKEQQAKAAKEKSATQANFNPWEALGGKKKKKKGKKEDVSDDDEEED